MKAEGKAIHRHNSFSLAWFVQKRGKEPNVEEKRGGEGEEGKEEKGVEQRRKERKGEGNRLKRREELSGGEQ